MRRAAVQPLYSPERTGIRIKRADQRFRLEKPGWFLRESSLPSAFRSLRSLDEIHLYPSRELESSIQQDAGFAIFLIDGELSCFDSQGHQRELYPGTFLYLHPRTQVACSLKNSSNAKIARFIELRFAPEGGAPLAQNSVFVERRFSVAERTGNLKLIASPQGLAGSLRIQQDARIFSGILPVGEVILDRIGEERHGWLQLVRGVMELNSEPILMGDGAEIQEDSPIELKVPVHGTEAELLLLDLG